MSPLYVLITLLFLLSLLNMLLLWYLCGFLVYALQPLLKTPLSHRACLGSLVGKLLFAHPVRYQVEVYTGRNEQKAKEIFLQLQQYSGVQHIDVLCDGKLYKSWQRPGVSPDEQPAHISWNPRD